MKDFDIKNIIEADVITNPWEYVLVDKFLPTESYEKITSEFISFVERTNEEKSPMNNNGLWPFELTENGFSVDVMQDIMDINKHLLRHASEIIEKFNYKNKSSVGYFSVPRLGLCPANAQADLHDDGEAHDKSLIMVVYLYPSDSLGTRLYTTKNEDSYVKTIDWKTNRSFLFVPQKDVTWHSFKSNSESRFTMNFYYERIEDMNYITNLSDRKIEWFYNEYTKGSIVDFLNEGKQVG